MSNASTREVWERRRSYLLRSMISDRPPLSPVLEESEEHSSLVEEQDLPELVVEVERRDNKHDHDEEYYERLHRRVRSLYYRLFVLGESNVSSGSSAGESPDTWNTHTVPEFESGSQSPVEVMRSPHPPCSTPSPPRSSRTPLSPPRISPLPPRTPPSPTRPSPSPPHPSPSPPRPSPSPTRPSPSPPHPSPSPPHPPPSPPRPSPSPTRPSPSPTRPSPSPTRPSPSPPRSSPSPPRKSPLPLRTSSWPSHPTPRPSRTSRSPTGSLQSSASAHSLSFTAPAQCSTPRGRKRSSGTPPECIGAMKMLRSVGTQTEPPVALRELLGELAEYARVYNVCTCLYHTCH